MLQQSRLSAPAFEVIHFNLAYEWPYGWRCSAIGRRSGDDDWEAQSYDNLDAEELHQCVADVLAAQLRL